MGLALPVVANAWMFPASVYPKPAGKYTLVTPSDSAAFASALKSGWSSWKNRFVNSSGYVTDPSGFTPNNGRVSEGVGYGMLLAVLNNDSAAFRSIWFNAETNFWYSKSEPYGWYGWQSNSQTNEDNMWGAPDAEEDVALALIFASALVRKKHWPDYQFIGNHKDYANPSSSVRCTISVDEKARHMLTSLSRYSTSQGTGFVVNDYIQHNTSPYAQTNTAGTVKITLQNMSYFAPAWYEVFKSYMSYNKIISANDWDVLIKNEYAVLAAQPNSSKGMARDWSLETGAYVKLGWMTGSLFGHVGDMWYDAIRVPYRIGMAAYWFQDANATAYTKKVWSGGAVSASSPTMFTGLDGTPSPNLPGLVITPRAMWAVSAYGGRAAGDAASTTAATTFHNALKSTNYAGSAQYFDESLGLLGGLVAGGCFPNIWDDLKASFPDTSAVLKTFTATIKGNKTEGTIGTDSVFFSASFDKAATCTVYVAGLKSKAQWKGMFKTTGTTAGTAKWKMGQKTSVAGVSFNSTEGEYVSVTLRWAGSNPATSVKVLDPIKMCGLESCTSVGIESQSKAKASLQRMADGSMLIRQPWFSTGSVRVRVRNAAGMSYFQSEMALDNGAIKLPSLSLAPGWYSVETEAAGQRSTQSFTLSH
jgi:endo-1,4-beta-D-glucanase Y